MRIESAPSRQRDRSRHRTASGLRWSRGDEALCRRYDTVCAHGWTADVGMPQPEVHEDLRDDLALFDEGFVASSAERQTSGSISYACLISRARLGQARRRQARFAAEGATSSISSMADGSSSCAS